MTSQYLYCQKDIVNKRGTSLSIINLIATPENYHGQKVYIDGYIAIDNDDLAIYLSKHDYDFFITKNAIWLIIEKEKLVKMLSNDTIGNGYYSIEGEFDMNNLGHKSLFSGSIYNITRIRSRNLLINTYKLHTNEKNNHE